MYVKGLLSVFTRKGWYSRYSLKCSMMAHFNARNSFSGMVILLMCGECLAAIGYWVKLSVFLFLGKNCSQSLLQGVCFQQEILGVISKS